MKNFEELNLKELREYEGGVDPVTGIAAIAVGCGMVGGALIVGAAVGYGIYKMFK